MRNSLALYLIKGLDRQTGKAQARIKLYLCKTWGPIGTQIGFDVVDAH